MWVPVHEFPVLATLQGLLPRTALIAAPVFRSCSFTSFIATMMDMNELGESACYLRQGYQEMMKVHTVPWDGK